MDTATEAPELKSEFALTLERTFEATPEQVWKAWTTPALLEQWFAPAPYKTSGVVIDATAGGLFRTVMTAPDGAEFANDGVILKAMRNRQLVFTDAFTPDWKPAGQPFMVVTIDITPIDGGKTHYVATVRHWNEATLKQHEAMGFHQGWGICADQLGALAKTL
ncbi:SRPBCC family protein [soil metagenome]